MKPLLTLPILVNSLVSIAAATTALCAEPAVTPAKFILMTDLGATADAQYHGDGLTVVPTPEGVRLRCVFQKLEGQVTDEGLWLSSTADPRSGGKFQVVARAVGREGALIMLPRLGVTSVADKLVRWMRPGLIEDYSVSVDGVRQDFMVMQRPGGAGPLRVELNVSGARVEALPGGARLVLDGSGRRIVYNRLQVVDAVGKELIARVELTPDSGLAVLVQDSVATYPIRIDPTFSDEDWTTLGGSPPDDNGLVYAAVVDGSGNVYIGGSFAKAGGISATNVAKWNGSTWSALGSGVNSVVHALAVSGSDLYVGGAFTNAGGISANRVAKWDGYSWSALGSGVENGLVSALARLFHSLA